MKSLTRQIGILTLLAVFGIIMTNTASAEKSKEIYKWTDKDGRVHYAARPGSASAQKMHLGSKIFHSRQQDDNKSETEKVDEERTKLCRSSKETLSNYKKAPFLYRYDEERKQKVRLSDDESKEAFLQAEKDISYWCNPAVKSVEAEKKDK